MKPKLLITLGCSWTEGVGCYVPSVYYNASTAVTFNDIEPLISKYHDKNKKNFHEFGWPNRLGKKLAFDKVINLGVGGSSNSTAVKIIYEFIEQNDI